MTTLSPSLVNDVRTEARNIVRAGLLGPEAVTKAHWTDNLPPDVRDALIKAEMTGAACDTTSDPVFYEVQVDFLRLNNNMISIAGHVTNAINEYLRRTSALTVAERSLITDQIRCDAYGSSFDAGLGVLLRWVAVKDDA